VLFSHMVFDLYITVRVYVLFKYQVPPWCWYSCCTCLKFPKTT